MKLSIVMPAFNERRTIREIINRVLKVDLGGLERELVIVDDGSSDGTREILAEYDGKHGGEDFQIILEKFRGLRDFYKKAAAGGRAVVFTVAQ